MERHASNFVRMSVLFLLQVDWDLVDAFSRTRDAVEEFDWCVTVDRLAIPLYVYLCKVVTYFFAFSVRLFVFICLFLCLVCLFKGFVCFV